MVVLTPDDVLRLGYNHFLGLRQHEQPMMENENHVLCFKKVYGSSPIVLARIWSLMQDTAINMTDNDKTEKGFRQLLVAIHFLWAYPKNAQILADSFSINLRQVEGENLWHWVQMIASIKDEVIIFPNWVENQQIFLLSVDGVDFRLWEKRHPTLPYDRREYSKKFNHGALKYEIGIDIFRSKVVWLSGPHRGGRPDAEIFREPGGLWEHIPDGKLVIADRAYRAEDPNGNAKCSFPNLMNEKQTAKFKARVRARHETFNGRLKSFDCLNSTFHHNRNHHKIVFEAVVVICQCQMDFGSPLFAP